MVNVIIIDQVFEVLLCMGIASAALSTGYLIELYATSCGSSEVVPDKPMVMFPLVFASPWLKPVIPNEFFSSGFLFVRELYFCTDGSDPLQLLCDFMTAIDVGNSTVFFHCVIAVTGLLERCLGCKGSSWQVKDYRKSESICGLRLSRRNEIEGCSTSRVSLQVKFSLLHTAMVYVASSCCEC
ncbi:hypothetical protein Ancab_023327 [Ancistrocladus abbreviatus]